ncbi:MAG: hypothetical protein KJN71_01200 [Acidimicrobiia bacterium]|nr:hypothetical protein [Acidimicrobiia bacterium]
MNPFGRSNPQQQSRQRQQAWWEGKKKAKRRRFRVEEEQRQEAASETRGRGTAASTSTVAQPQRAIPPAKPVSTQPGRVRRIGRVFLGGLLLAAAAVMVLAFWPAAIPLFLLGLWVLRPQRRVVETGVASSVDLRYSSDGGQALAFRMQRWNRRGERLSPVAVVMEGKELRGQIRDGDRVEVSGKRGKGGSLDARSVLCLDTGQIVDMKRPGVVASVAGVLMFIISIGLFVLVLAGIFSAIGNAF